MCEAEATSQAVLAHSTQAGEAGSRACYTAGRHTASSNAPQSREAQTLQFPSPPVSVPAGVVESQTGVPYGQATHAGFVKRERMSRAWWRPTHAALWFTLKNCAQQASAHRWPAQNNAPRRSVLRQTPENQVASVQTANTDGGDNLLMPWVEAAPETPPPPLQQPVIA